MSEIKILVINPNSTAAATEGILTAAREYAAGHFQVDALGNADGPDFIDTDEDRIAAAPGMRRIVEQTAGQYDGYVVACHCDPNVPALRRLTDRPVVGIGEASIRMAALLGRPFAVVTTGEASLPHKRRQLAALGLDAVPCRPGVAIEGAGEAENSMYLRLLRGAQTAVEQDGAQVIVPAITGFPGLDRFIEERLCVSVVDGLACALFLCRDLSEYAEQKKRKEKG